MNDNEKNIIDSENEANSISPKKTDSNATINEINVEVDKENINPEKVNKENVKLIEVNEEPINSDESKEKNEDKNKAKEGDVNNETLLIPADREEVKTEVKTETLEKGNDEEGNFMTDNLPLISVGVIVIVLIAALVIKKLKK